MGELSDVESSNVNGIALVLLLLALWVILSSSRSNAACALLLVAIFIPFGQQFIVGGLHLRFTRLLILAGFVRLLLRREHRSFQPTRLDVYFIGWWVACVICGVLRGARAETFGIAYDGLGAFFLFRHWLLTREDLLKSLRMLGFALIGLGFSMAYEWLTHRNLFSAFGGVPEETLVREGRLRCQGSFRHPILAGTFAASIFPLMVSWWNQGGERLRAFLAISASVFCTYAAGSSGAGLTFLAAAIGLMLWKYRQHLRRIQIGAVCLLLIIAAVMEPPIWFLISRISEIAGGTGWYRSHLIDQAVNHFSEWWLIGSSYTSHWATTEFHILPMDPDNIDITNHYIEQGLQGGLIGMGFFVATFVWCFRALGKSLRAGHDLVSKRLQWGLGVCIFAHCAAFVSVSYFDQMLTVWCWTLACVPVVTTHVRSTPASHTAKAERETLTKSVTMSI